MADFKLTLRELEDGREFEIGEAHIVHASIGGGHLVEMEDINFHFDSPVLLPDPHCDDDPDAPAQDRITGLSVLATVLTYADEHNREQLLIAGHADTKGGADYNVTLSQRRADNVLFALIGNKEAWARLSFDHHQVEDVQAILKWIDVKFAFGTDPGAIDNVNGPQTQAAIKTFKQRFNSDFGTSMPIDGSSLGMDGWRAFFDLYMQGLRDLLGVDEEGLADLRGALTFLDGENKTVGCGENHPIEAPDKDDFRSATNRRVEMLFFDPKDRLPKLACHASAGKCDPKACEIYGKGLFDFLHIPCGGATPGFSGEFGPGEIVEPDENAVEPAQQTGDDPPPRPRFNDPSGVDGDA